MSKQTTYPVSFQKKYSYILFTAHHTTSVDLFRIRGYCQKSFVMQENMEHYGFLRLKISDISDGIAIFGLHYNIHHGWKCHQGWNERMRLWGVCLASLRAFCCRRSLRLNLLYWVLFSTHNEKDIKFTLRVWYLHIFHYNYSELSVRQIRSTWK